MIGLVAGSVAPDLPMILPMPYGYDRAHSAVGVVTGDAVAGIVMALLWTFLVRDPAVDSGPAWLRERVDVTGTLSVRQLSLLPVAVIIGAATHVLWDEFTHEGRWGAVHIPWLADDHLGHAGYHWAQAASSALGLAVVIVAGSLTLARRPPRPNSPRLPTLARWLAAAVAGTATVVAIVAGSRQLDRGLHAAAIAVAVNGLAAFVLTAVVAALAWQLADSRG